MLANLGFRGVSGVPLVVTTCHDRSRCRPVLVAVLQLPARRT